MSGYDLAIERMVSRLRRMGSVVSIFQIGNTNNPGISDIDMLVVFEDEAKCNFSPLKGLSRTERYLFSHNLYGVSRKYFSDAQKYTFFHNYNLLWGEELPLDECNLSKEGIRILKTQIALEYLIKMFVDCTIEQTYGIVKVRGLLMHVKALSYDLEFLNVSSGRLFDLVQTIIDWRNDWFENRSNRQAFREWFPAFHAALTDFLGNELAKQGLYLPEDANLCISRNMKIEPSDKFRYSHKGMVLPSLFGSLGRKYFNIQHRFNKFRFQIPAAVSNIPDVLHDRFILTRQMIHINSKFFSYFIPLSSSLNIFSKISRSK